MFHRCQKSTRQRVSIASLDLRLLRNDAQTRGNVLTILSVSQLKGSTVLFDHRSRSVLSWPINKAQLEIVRERNIMALETSHPDVSPAIATVQADIAVLHRSQPWYLAYMDALFETDRTRIGERIKRAEQLMIRREHEFLSSKPGSPEQRALANALHALRALRSCFGV